MLILHFLSITVILISYLVGDVISFPVEDNELVVDVAPRTSDSSTGHAYSVPRFALYVATPEFPSPADVKGYNVLKLGNDSVNVWLNATKDWRKRQKEAYRKAGIRVLMVSVAPEFAYRWLLPLMDDDSKRLSIDVVDFDLGYPSSEFADGMKLHLVIVAMKAYYHWHFHARIFKPVYTVTLDASWFEPDARKFSYLESLARDIHWFNIQYFNSTNASDDYDSCSTLLEHSPETHPKTSVYELVDRGIPMKKIVIVKQAQGNSSHMSADTLGSCLNQARKQRPTDWVRGVEGFKYPGANPEWIETVKASWPVSA